jgi:hypothetical protein
MASQPRLDPSILPRRSRKRARRREVKMTDDKCMNLACAPESQKQGAFARGSVKVLGDLRVLSIGATLALIANTLFVVSLALPCGLWDDYPVDRIDFGFKLLFMGWAGPVAGDFAWYANIPFFYVTCRARRKKPVRARGFLAGLLVLAGCLVIFPGMHEFSWYLSHAIEVWMGVYVWAGSMLLAACVAMIPPGGSLKS